MIVNYFSSAYKKEERMYLKKDIDVNKFLSAVKLCEKEVYFETDEGDSLCLRSALCQYIFCTLTNKPEILYNGHIRLENFNDLKYLQEFIKEE